MILQSDKLPTTTELMHKLQAETDFAPDGDRPAVFSAGGGTGFCFNCDTAGHINRV